MRLQAHRGPCTMDEFLSYPKKNQGSGGANPKNPASHGVWERSPNLLDLSTIDVGMEACKSLFLAVWTLKVDLGLSRRLAEGHEAHKIVAIIPWDNGWQEGRGGVGRKYIVPMSIEALRMDSYPEHVWQMMFGSCTCVVQYARVCTITW